MKSLAYTSLFIVISILLGYLISSYAGLSWPSASVAAAAFLIMWGTWSFSDDADVLSEDATTAGDFELADKLAQDKRRNETVNTWIIFALITLALFYELAI
jgi:hypothetical protein